MLYISHAMCAIGEYWFRENILVNVLEEKRFFILAIHGLRRDVRVLVINIGELQLKIGKERKILMNLLNSRQVLVLSVISAILTLQNIFPRTLRSKSG